MKPVTVKCSCCNGTGKTPLSTPLQRTLDVVSTTRWMSTMEIEKALGDEWVKSTAINNRLAVHLLPLGLIARDRRGKSLFWKRVK